MEYGNETIPPPLSIMYLLFAAVISAPVGWIHLPTLGCLRPVLQTTSRNLPLALAVMILVLDSAKYEFWLRKIWIAISIKIEMQSLTQFLFMHAKQLKCNNYFNIRTCDDFNRHCLTVSYCRCTISSSTPVNISTVYTCCGVWPNGGWSEYIAAECIGIRTTNRPCILVQWNTVCCSASNIIEWASFVWRTSRLSRDSYIKCICSCM